MSVEVRVKSRYREIEKAPELLQPSARAGLNLTTEGPLTP